MTRHEGDTMTTLAPLVVLKQTAECCGCRVEMTLYTDGLRAYAVSLDLTAEIETVEREGALITADCQRENCAGFYEWALDQSEWTGDAEARRMVREYGTPMELR